MGNKGCYVIKINAMSKGGSRGGGGTGGPDPPLEFWQKSGNQIRDWDRFDIAQHLCKLQS